MLKRLADLDEQINSLIVLHSRGKIKAKLIDRNIEELQKEKEDLEIRSKDLADISVILDVKVEDFSNEMIREQLVKFDTMVDGNNLVEMRGMVRDFIYKITLYPKKDSKTKAWRREIRLIRISRS